MELIDDNILIEQDKSEDKSAGGIVLPDIFNTHPFKGKVMAVGVGRLLKNGKRVPLQCKVGDTVLYGAVNRSDVVYEGKKYIVIKEQHLLGIDRT